MNCNKNKNNLYNKKINRIRKDLKIQIQIFKIKYSKIRMIKLLRLFH